MAYEDYRINPSAQPGVTTTQGGPASFRAPSSSFWGNMRENTPGGSAVAAVPLLGQAAALGGSFTNAFTKDGNFVKNLGNVENWKNFASFGSHDAKKKQRAAKAKRKKSVRAWRQGESQRIGSLMDQNGSDVSMDLQGELDAALGAGGDMGDQGAINSSMTAFQDRYNRYMLGRQRAGQARQVDAMMTDPGRLAARGQRLENTRQDGIRQLADQFRMGARNNAFNQARRGTQGGSMDIEQRGDLARQRNAGGMQLQSGVDQMAQNYRLGDQRQRATLMGLIHSDDPTSAALFQNTLQGINDSNQNEQERSAQDRQMQQFRTASGAANSQILGGTLSQLGTGIGNRMDQEGTGV